MSIHGVRVECYAVESSLSFGDDVIFARTPLWIEELPVPATSVNAVQVNLASPYRPTPMYVFRITARESAYVLVGSGTLTPNALNAMVVPPGDQILMMALPGDRLAWASAPADSVGIIDYYDGLPEQDGVAASGASAQVARGDHVHPIISPADIGLGNVDNTADADKPISTAMQAALDGKITRIDVDTILAVPGTYATLKSAMAAADTFISEGVTVGIVVTGHVSVADTAGLLEITSPFANRMTLTGANTPLAKTFAATGHTIAGSSGNWTCTYKLTDVVGISVGDLLKVDAPTNADGTFVWCYDLNAGYGQGKATTVGTALTITSNVTDFLTTDWLVWLKGQQREIVAKASAISFTLNAALAADVSGQVYWYALKKAAGTIEMTGTDTVNGTGTTFTKYAKGDVLFSGQHCLRILNVTSDTSMTVAFAATIPAGSVFGVHCHAKAHCGSFVITAVDAVNNTVTVTNKMVSGMVNLSSGQITGGTCKVLRDVVTNTNGPGIILEAGGFATIDNIGFVGSGTTTAVGFNVGDHEQIFGNNVALTNWGIGLSISSGSVYWLYPSVANITGAYAVYNRTGHLHTRYGYFSVSGSYVLFRSTGSGSYTSNTTIIGGNVSDYANARASIYADGLTAIGPTSNGLYDYSGAAGHRVENWVWCAGNVGRYAGMGAGGRDSGIRVFGTAGVGISYDGANVEAHYGIVAGSSSANFAITGGTAQLDSVASFGSATIGIQVSNDASVTMPDAIVLGNVTYGVYLSSGASCRDSSGLVATGSSTHDVAVVNPGTFFDASSALSVGSYSQAKNVPSNGALIYDSGLGAMKTIAVIGQSSVTWDIPPLSSSTVTATTTTTIVGAVARDMVVIGRPNIANANVVVQGVVSASDVVTLDAVISTAGSADPSNATYDVTVLRVV